MSGRDAIGYVGGLLLAIVAFALWWEGVVWLLEVLIQEAPR